MDRRTELLKYLKDRHDRTQFPFIKLTDVTNRFGEEIKDELNKLGKEKLVRSRPGINSVLVEITTKGIEFLKKLKF